jgi:hypothetical protein
MTSADFLFSSTHAEEGQNEHHDHDQTDEIDDGIHVSLSCALENA